MPDTVQLSHPDPSKKGAVIDKHRYEVVKERILSILSTQSSITFKDLLDEVEGQLTKAGFDGSPSWYCTWVKLDLEAKQIIERVKGASPQQVRLAEKE